jgi:exodeoxyribonuclease V alpha subunit
MKSLLTKQILPTALSPLAQQFTEFLTSKIEGEFNPNIALTLALLVESNIAGDVCIDLGSLSGKALFDSEAVPIDTTAPDLKTWIQQLLDTGFVGIPGEQQPVIIDQDRLYLYQYWNDESIVAKQLLSRSKQTISLDEARLHSMLDQLFSGIDRSESQRRAAALCCRHPFAVVSGGPGTGKTTTIVKILSLLLDQNSDMKISLAAPTGKAAAHMLDSIRTRSLEQPLSQQLLEALPDKASTLHRLLGAGRGGYRFNRENPINTDCLIIDEASMLDISMTRRILEALPEHARLILLGDRDQLASVAAGNVLADITGQGHDPLNVNSLSTGLKDSIAILDTSFRFDGTSHIGSLAAAVNAGNIEAVYHLLETEDKSLNWYRSDTDKLDPLAMDWIIKHYQPVLEAKNIEEALTIYESFRVLCAQHAGALGVDAVNHLLTDYFLRASLISNPDSFRGQPLLITQNFHELDLYNGDTGLVWPDKNGVLRAWFRTRDNALRSISLSIIPQINTAWAMTVHKSQGSEFNDLLLLLPATSDSALLNRSLIYTAITRTRQNFQIQSSRTSLAQACFHTISRQSGLAAKLGWLP